MSTFGFNSGYVEDLYTQYLQDPDSVSASWREFFADYRPGPTFRGGDAPAVELRAVESEPAPSAAPEPKAKPAAPNVRERDGAPPPPKAPAASNGEKPAPPVEAPEGAQVSPIRGVAGKIVENMEASLAIPVATSVRTVPVKLMMENRRLINEYQRTVGGDKVSFTHLIAYAIVRGLATYPGMNAAFRPSDKKGVAGERVDPAGAALGLAIDIEKNGKRQLMVPNVKDAGRLSFAGFLGAYNDIVRRARGGELQVADFQNTSATLTNPGMIGTVMSVPRLMPGQGVIVAAGAIGYPPEYSALPPNEVARLGISPIMTLTSTYDHRVIQGAESGEFLNYVARALQGEHRFYEEVFASLGIPTPPFHAATDSTPLIGHQPLGGAAELDHVKKQARVLQLIRAYRVRGHLLADTNPLGPGREHHPELDPAEYGLTVWDLDRLFVTGELGTSGGQLAGREALPLRDILDIIWETYTRKVGVEFMHISTPQEKRWLIERVEPVRFQDAIAPEMKRRILEKLNEAEALESFIHTKYIGHKRFSLEGGETLIPILDLLLSDAADQEAEEVVIGMAHRGRLNVLANILGKPYKDIFGEFEGTVDPGSVQGSGDVKYHLGQHGTHTSPAGSTVEVTLAPNPSHLEAVNPVVEGMVRAKQRLVAAAGGNRVADNERVYRDQVIPVLIHGDAAFAGQGVVAETLNLSQLDGYKTGGTIHVVVNNQIGFTTLPIQARSSAYATDIARMIQAPIFHVNGDDPEAAIRVARLALDYRQVFNKDVVIDMVCYRKYGHNEGDEPAYTQPLMYDDIGEQRSVRKKYMEQLLRRGELTPDRAEKILDSFRDTLTASFEEMKGEGQRAKPEAPQAPDSSEPDTSVPEPRLQRILRTLVDFPDDFAVHKKLARLIGRREKQFEDDKIDWAFGEALAFGSLLQQGVHVRLSGQDSQRGTFSQRHAVLHDQENGQVYVPLNHLYGSTEGDKVQADFTVNDSLLSEYAALGFEYGYTLGNPEALVLWEAQFGDFVNGAQIMIDQFIAAAEAKWGDTSSLVMLLPHGFEGQGPEHSSARMERFLQLAAEENIIVANYTEPANYFHALRRQALRKVQKPLVIMTPKSLLRHPKAVSAVADFTDAGYRPVIASDRDAADRLVFCSGKVYYDLLARRDEAGANVAIARLEQVYPFSASEVQAEIERHPGAAVVWAQEEPKNMGSWTFVEPRLRRVLRDARPDEACPEPVYAGRRAAASPAAGSSKVHAAEQAALVDEALGLGG